MKIKMNSVCRKTVPGFTLIELSIVMIIVGIIMAGVFKGQDLIESARLQSTLSEFNRLKLAALQYREQFGYWPGNDSKAHNRFGEGVTNGSGSGLISSDESTHVWKHLAASGHLDSDSSPLAKIGGNFSIRGDIPGLKGNWIILSAGDLNPILTPKQAMNLKSKLDEPDPTKGKIRVVNGEGAGNGCVNGATYNVGNDNPVCVVAMFIG